MRRFLAGIWATLGFLLLAGCSDPAHQQRLEVRRDSFNRAIHAFEDTESRRPGNLAHTAEVARQKNEQDVQKTARNPDAVAKMLGADFRRFQESQPEYQRRIAEQLRGKPENIERTLPYFLY